MVNRRTPKVCILRSKMAHSSLSSTTDFSADGDRDEEGEREPVENGVDGLKGASESNKAGATCVSLDEEKEEVGTHSALVGVTSRSKYARKEHFVNAGEGVVNNGKGKDNNGDRSDLSPEYVAFGWSWDPDWRPDASCSVDSPSASTGGIEANGPGITLDSTFAGPDPSDIVSLFAVAVSLTMAISPRPFKPRDLISQLCAHRNPGPLTNAPPKKEAATSATMRIA
jgi:hypothetical protein